MGKVICEEHRVSEGWEEYFKDLLNKVVEEERTKMKKRMLKEYKKENREGRGSKH